MSATRHRVCCRACATHAAAQRLQPLQNSRGGCLNTPTRGIWPVTSAQWGALDRTPWSISQTPIPGMSAAQELPGGTACTLKIGFAQMSLCCPPWKNHFFPASLFKRCLLPWDTAPATPALALKGRISRRKTPITPKPAQGEKWMQSFLPLKMCLLLDLGSHFY